MGLDKVVLCFGKDAAKSGESSQMQIVDGIFTDPRWISGSWDTSQFKGGDGEVDWDLVSTDQFMWNRSSSSRNVGRKYEGACSNR